MTGRMASVLVTSTAIAWVCSACTEGRADRGEVAEGARPVAVAPSGAAWTSDMRLAPTAANRRIGANRSGKSASARAGLAGFPDGPSRAGAGAARGLDPLMHFAPALVAPSARVASANRRPPPELDPWNPPAPQVHSQGGVVLATPRLAPIFYDADPFMESLDAFTQRLGASEFWGFAAEYGVGPATKLPRTVIPGAVPARLTSSQVGLFVKNELAPGGLFPAYDPNTIYTIFFSADTTITIPGFGDSCKEFGAYHSITRDRAGRLIPYAVIPRCDGYLDHFGIDTVTSAVSHELIEAATDPFEDAFLEVDWQGSGMSFAFEGASIAEVSDFCEFMPGADRIDPEVGGLVERYWSNQRAAAWHDPCVPAPNRPYFNALPILGGTTTGSFEWAKGVTVPPGGQVTIPVKLFADAPTDAWELSAAEGVNPHLPPDTFNQLSFSFDVPHGRAGDVRYLTIRRTPLPPGQRSGFLPFAIVSKQGAVENFWWVVVGE